jgi:hypothetical protein
MANQIAWPIKTAEPAINKEKKMISAAMDSNGIT